MLKLVIFILFSVAIGGVFPSNILYLSSVASPSHFIWCRALLNSLVDRGYNVTALSPDVEVSKNITYIHLEQIYPELYNGSKDLDFFEIGKLPPIALFPMYSSLSEMTCTGALRSKGYQQLLEYPNDFKVM